MKIEIENFPGMIRDNGRSRNRSLRVFEGASAIVTGGASGIGRALGEQLSSLGATVCLADRQLDEIVKAAAEIRDNGGKAMAAHLDVSNYSAVERVVREMVSRSGRLDYMFNNAGIAIGGALSLHDIDDWHRIVDVNFRGVVNGVQAAYQVMLQQGFGHIVNTASMAGLLPAPGGVAYAATKYAVVGLSRSLRAEAAMHDIHVSALCPGAVRTPILQGGGKFGKSHANLSSDQERRMWDRLRPISPDAFAKKALGAVARNKAIIIVPPWWKLFWYIDRFCPFLSMAIARKSFRDLQSISEGQPKRRPGRGRYAQSKTMDVHRGSTVHN